MRAKHTFKPVAVDHLEVREVPAVTTINPFSAQLAASLAPVRSLALNAAAFHNGFANGASRGLNGQFLNPFSRATANFGFGAGAGNAFTNLNNTFNNNFGLAAPNGFGRFRNNRNFGLNFGMAQTNGAGFNNPLASQFAMFGRRGGFSTNTGLNAGLSNATSSLFAMLPSTSAGLGSTVTTSAGGTTTTFPGYFIGGPGGISPGAAQSSDPNINTGLVSGTAGGSYFNLF